MTFRSGTIIAFCGLLGSGKTLAMTYFALRELRVGRRVRANYDTSCFERLENLPQLYTSEQCVLCMDEFQVNIDSRNFSKNQQFTYWLLLIRKLGVTLIYTTQHINQVDLRLRQITNFIFWCYPHRPGFSKIDVLRYGGADEAYLIRSFVLDQRPIYGLYDTYDKRVALSPDRDGCAYCPFPFEEFVPAGPEAPQGPTGGGRGHRIVSR